ncbi:hypothetical protein Lal_00000787 [Lupinus albus]|nr:hypothetical protein Lal_00000787 [Lupinus albus]
MQFTAGATLKQRELPNIPELEYDFKKISDILSGNFWSDLLIEVVGVFDKLIFSQSQSNLKKVIFSMKDFFGDVISCTLWEAYAIKFLNFYNNQPSLQPLVILLTNARVKEGQVVKSINEISSLTSFEEMTCVTVGTTTMFVVGRPGSYYDGCAKCTKNSDVKDGPFTYKYKLEIKVNHEHSCGRFVFWDRQCDDMIDISASELKNQMLAEGEDDPKAFPLVLDELLARTMVLRVKVQPSDNQSSVIRLSEDPNLIKKVFGQIGVFEPTTSDDFKGKIVCSDFLALESSVSMTADHDPEQFQVVTPGKRLSVEIDLDLLESPVYNFTHLSSSKITKHMKTK